MFHINGLFHQHQQEGFNGHSNGNGWIVSCPRRWFQELIFTRVRLVFLMTTLLLYFIYRQELGRCGRQEQERLWPLASQVSGCRSQIPLKNE